MARVWPVVLSQLSLVGFILALCAASALCDPIAADQNTSVATPRGSSQLVASASDRDQGVGPEQPLSLLPSADEKKAAPDSASSCNPPPPASEVGDLMKDPYHNITLSITDRDEEAMINNETDIIYDPHVSRLNKTHEEEGENTSTEAPLGGSTRQSREDASVQDSSPSPATDGSTRQSREDASVQDSSPSPATDGATVIAELAETEEKKYSDKTSEEVNSPEKEGSVSLAEATSLPASALVSQHDNHDHTIINKTTSLNHTTQAAAILAGVLVLIAVMGYLGMLLWRRVLEKRYGNREMLVNEEDDFKHFEL